MRAKLLLSVFVWSVVAASASPPDGYYAPASGKTGQVLRQALHNTIDDHRVIKYSSKNPDTADAMAKLDVRRTPKIGPGVKL
jgi:hypothetical protein